MKNSLAKLIVFLLLVALVLFIFLTIQDPYRVRHDWAATQSYAARQWHAVQHWWAGQVAPPVHQQPAVHPPVPVAPAAVAAPPPPAPLHFPQNLTPAQYALLMAARSAFWQHDQASAIADYRALIRQRQNIPQLYGELGNLYYQAGHRLAAGEAYAHAAESLISHHQYPAAAALLPLIHSLAPDQVPAIREDLAR